MADEQYTLNEVGASLLLKKNGRPVVSYLTQIDDGKFSFIRYEPERDTERAIFSNISPHEMPKFAEYAFALKDKFEYCGIDMPLSDRIASTFGISTSAGEESHMGLVSAEDVAHMNRADLGGIVLTLDGHPANHYFIDPQRDEYTFCRLIEGDEAAKAKYFAPAEMIDQLGLYLSARIDIAHSGVSHLKTTVNKKFSPSRASAEHLIGSR